MDASDREKWIRYGHALKNSDVPGGFEIWYQWSSSASKGYHGEIDCKKTWDSFNPNNIHFETIFKDASMLGWKKPPWEKKKSSKTIEKMPLKEAILNYIRMLSTFVHRQNHYQTGILNRIHHFGYVHVWKLVL